MRTKFNKKIEFFIKNLLFTASFLLKKRLKRSINNKDENELELLKNFIKPNTDTIDVGVYRGVYSYEMSKYSKKVHSFEANPIIFKYINKNLKKILKNIKLYNYALSNQSGLLKLKIPIRNSNYTKDNFEEYYQMGRATIHENNNFEEYEEYIVKAKKIDEFKFNNLISFIKIDVEGHELEVIDGGKLTIRENKPVLLVEIEERHSKKKIDESIKFINNFGYKSFFYDKKELKCTYLLNNNNEFNNFIFLPN